MQPDNPKGIQSLQDLVRTRARFINRQRGSGTRLAVERLLEEQGIDRGEIVGFYSEEFTHLAVAAAVASGMADVGVGIEAAARKLRLAFIPLFTEDYYLLAKKEMLEQKNVADLIAVLKSATFRSLVSAIPGYDVQEAGVIKTIGEVT
jgi:molybdate-binding protein